MPPIQVIGHARREEKEAEERVAAQSCHPATGGVRNNGVNHTRASDATLNHLLSFTLPPRAHPPPRTSRRSGRNAPTWGRSTRERYLNAQFKFMLKPTGDYTVHFADPDIYFNWPDVLQVLVPTSTVLPAAAQPIEGPSTISADSLLPSCPICLSEPVAPRMTKCGHIFCYPCVLHYLELSDQTGQKCRSCPICYDTVYGRELKSVKWYDPVTAASQAEAEHPPYQLIQEQRHEQQDDIAKSDRKDDYITMRLIYRTTISTLALPKSSTWPSDLIPPHAAPWYFLPDIFTYSRFMLATPDYMANELRDDMRQLNVEEANLKQFEGGSQSRDDLGLTFVESAKRKVEEQLEKVSLLRTEMVQRSSETAWLELEAMRERQARSVRREQQRQQTVEYSEATTSTSTDETAEDQGPPEGYIQSGAATGGAYTPSTAGTKQPNTAQRTSTSHPGQSKNNRNNRHRANVNPPAPNDATYYFYQASSGQHIYLHPLDIKILKSYFGEYSNFPESIRVRIDGIEEGSMNEDLRKRCRYLAHLPSGCDITFVESDLQSIMPASALAPYAQALKKRSTKRRDKARKDDKAKLKAEQVEKEKERDQFKRLTENYSRLSASRPRVHDIEGDFSLFPGLGGNATMQEQNGLRPVSSREGDAPLSISPASPPGGGAPGHRTVWGTQAIASSHALAQEEGGSDSLLDGAWQDFDSVQDRGGRRQGRKKKVVLNLSGGSVRMGR